MRKISLPSLQVHPFHGNAYIFPGLGASSGGAPEDLWLVTGMEVVAPGKYQLKER